MLTVEAFAAIDSRHIVCFEGTNYFVDKVDFDMIVVVIEHNQ